MADLKEKVLPLIGKERMLGTGDRVLAAVSGGADSMTLLSVLLELREALGLDLVAAAHMNHGLRGAEADRDEQLVRAFCAARNVPFFVSHADVAGEAKRRHCGIEEAGRAVRYAFFDKVADENGFDRIAVAHNQNDNAETVLLHLVRGTGTAGLCGILPVRGRIIRPLLTCSREEIEVYCEQMALPFVTDSTNSDVTFARNRIRNCVVPELYKINLRANEAICRLADTVRADEEYWQATTAAAITQAALRGAYDAEKLRALPTALRARVLRQIVSDEAGITCDTRQLQQLEALLTNGGAVTLSRDVAASVKQNYFSVKSDSEPPVSRPLEDGGVYSFGTDTYRAEVWDRKKFENEQKIHKILLQFTCDYDKIQGVAFVRSRKTGDVYTPYRRGGRKTLKKFMNEERIPAALRDRVPVIEDEQGIALVVGLGCDERVAITPSTQRILVIFIVNKKGR